MSTGYNVYVMGAIFIAVGIGISFLVLYFKKSVGEQRLKNAKLEAKAIIDEATRNAEAVRKEASLVPRTNCSRCARSSRKRPANEKKK